jgi:hypothetical protein
LKTTCSMVGISIIQLSPLHGDMRLDRRHRHLGPSAGDQGGEDDPEQSLLTGQGRAGEHESEGAAGALHSWGDAGVGWFEAEAVPLFEGLDPLGQAAGQREKLLRAAIGVDQVLIEDAHCRRSRKPSSATGACKYSGVAV